MRSRSQLSIIPIRNRAGRDFGTSWNLELPRQDVPGTSHSNYDRLFISHKMLLQLACSPAPLLSLISSTPASRGINVLCADKQKRKA